MPSRAPTAPPHRGRATVDSWLRGLHLSWFSILVLGLIVLSIVVLAPSFRMLVEQRQQIAQLQASLKDQKQTVDALTSQRARWADPAYIKSQARDRLFYVMPGEYAYLIIDDVAAKGATDPRPASADLQQTQVDWTSALLSSYVAAGISDAPVGSRR